MAMVSDERAEGADSGGSELRPSQEFNGRLMFVTFLALCALAASIVAIALYATDREGGAGGGGGESASGTSFSIEADNFVFRPDSYQAPADQDVSVELVNVSAIEHNWTVLQEGTTIAEESEYSDDLSITQIVVAANETASDTINLPAGSYQVICTVAGHFAAGMKAQLTVS